jgi:hypothetical protein
MEQEREEWRHIFPVRTPDIKGRMVNIFAGVEKMQYI